MVSSWVVTQEVLGQHSENGKESTQSVNENSNSAETSIGGASVEDAEKVEKACQNIECIQTIENRQSYETEEEKRKFISESFQLDTNEILSTDAKLKEAVIQLFVDNFDVLATHPNQYGETEVLEMKIDLIPGAIPYKSRVRPLNPDQKENLRDQIDEWLEQGVIEPSISPWVSQLVPLKKKDERTRLVTDLRELNKQTVKDNYPLTNI